MKVQLKKAVKAVKKTPKSATKTKTTVTKVQDSRIYFLLDNSTSMLRIAAEALDGYNTFVEEQRKVKGKSKITLITFHDKINVLYRDADLAEVKPLMFEQYAPRGMTSLYDAIASILSEVKSTSRPKNEKVIIAILTDGEDTSSQQHTYHSVQPLMNSVQNELGYEVIFVGTNINAKAVAGNMGIKVSNTTNFEYTGKGVSDVMKTVSVATTAFRGASASVGNKVYAANAMFNLSDLYDDVKNNSDQDNT